MQSGSLCHNLCDSWLLVSVFLTMLLKQGRLAWSHQGIGNVGAKVGPVSADILMPSTYPTEPKRGAPHPMMKASPAAERRAAMAFP
jgi:hypothetical protein